MTQDREIQTGDRFVDGDGHLWTVVRATETTVTLTGRAIEQEFAVDGQGIVSDREFSRVEVPVCEHGFVEGEGCRRATPTARRSRATGRCSLRSELPATRPREAPPPAALFLRGRGLSKRRRPSGALW